MHNYSLLLHLRVFLTSFFIVLTYSYGLNNRISHIHLPCNTVKTRTDFENIIILFMKAASQNWTLFRSPVHL